MGLTTIPGIGGDGTVTATTTAQKIANSVGVQRVVTIQSLKDVAGTVDGETVLTEGYYTKADCEPLSYYWDADSVLADDGVDATHPGLVVQPTATSGAGRWVARRPKYINVCWYGASTSLSDNKPYIQQAVNQCLLQSWPKHIFIPGGTYTCASGILCKKDSNGDKQPEAFSLLIEGEGGFPYGLPQSSELLFTHNDTFGIGIQFGKGIRIRNIEITGRNLFSFATPRAAYTNAESEYVINSCRDNQFSPYAGIAIDPFGPSSILEANRYPGYSAEYPVSHTGGGTTDVKVEDVRINGFVTNIVISPNGVTQNAEQMEFKRVRSEQCKVAYAIGQLQSRSVRIEDFTCWGNCLYFVNCSMYGQGSGQLPYITGGNMAGHMKYLLQCNSSVVQAQIDNLFCESLYSLGLVNVDVMTFEGCIFKWGLPDATFAIPHAFLSSAKNVNFDGCFLLHTANPPNSKPINFSVTGRLRFDNCTFDVPPTNVESFEQITHRNSFFRHLAGGGTGRGAEYTLGGTVIADPFSSYNGIFVAPAQRVMFRSSEYSRDYENLSPPQRLENCEGSAVTVTVDSATNTGTFTSSFPIRWNVATRGSCPVYILNNLANEFGTNNYISAFVSSVSGSTITLGGLPPQMTTGSYSVYSMLPYRWHEPCIGDTTNGSPTITNVRCVTSVLNVWAVGNMISGSGIPVGTYITARDNTAKTITLSQNATATATGVDLFDAIVKCTARSAAAPTTRGWTKGDLIDDTTGATNGWRCTASGTFGSGTDPTFATR